MKGERLLAVGKEVVFEPPDLFSNRSACFVRHVCVKPGCVGEPR